MSHPMRDLRRLKESLEQSVRQIEAKKGVDYVVLADNLSPEDVGFVERQPSHSRIGQYILGGCVAAIALTIATSVFAGPVKIIDTGVYVEMVGVDAGYVIEYHNDLSHVAEPAPFPLDVGGVEAVVSLHLQSGNTPDHLSVSPPVGFYCDPCSLSVKEGEIGQVFLYPMGLS